MSIELLSLISPSSPNLELMPRATDSSAITAQDVAAALALMSFYSSSLLLQVYQHDSAYHDFLVSESCNRIKRHHPELFHGIQWCKKLNKLVQLVLRDLEHPAQCPQCLGRGVIYTFDGASDCEECHNGRVRPSIERLARRVGVTRQAWYRSWDVRHKAVSYKIGGWLAEAESVFSRNLNRA